MKSNLYDSSNYRDDAGRKNRRFQHKLGFWDGF